MLKHAFDSIQCLICYEKECREYLLKRYFVCYHFNINNLIDKERKEFFWRYIVEKGRPFSNGLNMV